MNSGTIFLLAMTALPAFAEGTGAVYTTTNAAEGNSVLAYVRSAGGSLSAAHSYPTGGLGTGSGLGSEGAIALSAGGRWLFAVNAGSNDITVFSADEHGGLTWRSKTPSGGTQPISVAIHGDQVVVLNAGGTPNISSFNLNEDGSLTPAASRNLNGAAPAEVAFNKDGSLLAVTEKNSNTIDLFVVDDGALSQPHTHPSNGATPFGFVFTRKDRMIVTEAGGGPSGTSAVSSYAADDDSGNLDLITASLPDTQAATCWAVATENGKYAFVANTHSGTLSSIGIARDGTLALLLAVAANPGAKSLPGDLALSAGSRFLYALTPGNGSITGFRVGPDGSLDLAASGTGVPSSAAGLAAR